MFEAKTIRDEIAEARKKGEALMATADKETRQLTDEERGQVEAHLAAVRAAKAKLERFEGDTEMRRQLAALGIGEKSPVDPHATGGHPDRPKAIPSLGAQFVASPAYDFVKAGRAKGTNWQSPAAELIEPQFHAATLTEDAASGGALLTTEYRPGIVPLLFKRLTVADLLAPGTTDATSVTYMRELVFTNAAAAVAEGATKPESTLTFEQAVDMVRKIAHWLPVTDEMLEDASQIRSYIDARLRLGLDLTEEDQLLAGSGVAPNLLGLRNRTGLAADVVRGADTNADAIFKQIMAIMTNAFLMPDGIVLNPTNWQTIVLGKDANGQYYGPGPFSSPQSWTLWGLPVSVTPAITAGVSLVGAYKQAAQVFRKGGTTVEASNSHSDFFVKNLTAIRAERRLALAVYRPAAIGEVTGLV